ncbi:MAG: CUE domain-containing protein [Bacillus sp. (in: Bacteria)]|nr:CUE domain-containing protein [Bacillus sp. (in: firmicutes)]
MKKFIIGVVALGLVFGIGTTVVAYSTEEGLPGFKEMLPFMQQMHPDWSDEELETMYRSCHGDGNRGNGMMGGQSF